MSGQIEIETGQIRLSKTRPTPSLIIHITIRISYPEVPNLFGSNMSMISLDKNMRC